MVESGFGNVSELWRWYNAESYNLTSPGYNYVPYSSLLNGDGSYYTNTVADRYSKSQQKLFLLTDCIVWILPLGRIGKKLVEE